jgi:hypothetical protein
MFTKFSTRLKSFSFAAVAGLAFLCGSGAWAADEPKPLATARHPLGVTVDVMEVSIDQTQKKLKVVWRYTNPTKKPIKLADSTPPGVLIKFTPYFQFYKEVNYRSGKLDADQAARYPIVMTVDGKNFDATDIKRLGLIVPAEGSFEIYAKFPMPIDKSGKIHLTLPDLPQFENLPIGASK